MKVYKLTEIAKKYWLAVFLILYIPVCYFIYGYAKLFDDNYIYLQYAKHFVENKELSFNLGEKSYAYTSPLWLAFHIALYRLISPEVIPLLLSIIFTLLTIILCYYFLKDTFLNRLSLFLVMLIISFDPNFLKHAFNGMETSCTYFFSYLILLGIIYTGKIKNNYLIGAVFGIFLLVRPESGILSFLTLSYLILFKKIKLKGVLQIAFTGSVVVLPWVIFTYLYYGKLLPDTFGAKGGDYKTGLNFLGNLFSAVKIFTGNYFAIFIFALIYLTRVPEFIKKQGIKNLFILLVMVIYILFYSAVFNNDNIYARYLCLVFPFFMISFLSFAEFTLPDVRKFNYTLASVFVILLLIGFTFSRMDKVMVDNYRRVEKEVIVWINDNTSKSSYITRGRIGEIGYKTQRRIFDPVGLINRDIAGYYQSGKILDYYLLKKPDYLIETSPRIVEGIGRHAQVKLVKEFNYQSGFLLRQKLFDWNPHFAEIKIYKVDWPK